MRRASLTVSDQRLFHYSREAIFDVLSDFGSYHAWWPPAHGVRVGGPLPAQPGTTIWFAYGPFVRWAVEVVDVRPPVLLALRYSDGALRGEAAWRLEADRAGCTRVTYDIDIEPTPAWLRAISRVWNLQPEHSRQIARVFTALDRRVAAVSRRRPGPACCAAG